MKNSAKSQTFTVSEEQNGVTILSWLRQAQPGKSWSQCRQILQSRRVFLNGVITVQDGRRLSTGDVISLGADGSAAPDDRALELVYFDREVIVIDKPVGIISYRRPEEQHWPLAQRLLDPSADELAAWAVWRQENRPPQGRHLARPRELPTLWRVHRLDRPTSGLLVFARHRSVGEGLIRQFEKHTVERTYVAFVHGTPTVGTIRSRLVRDRGDGLRGSTRDPQAGQPAITHILEVEKAGPYSRIVCRLETGRTHQIRIHLSESGHPLCGDDRYGQQPNKKSQGVLATENGQESGEMIAGDDSVSVPATASPPTCGSIPRLALHASSLKFLHPTTGLKLDFTSPLPADLAEWWQEQQAAAGTVG